jgi:serine/threonine-protein kinase HipA
MAKRLDVYLFEDLVGDLIQDDHGELRFQYSDDWLSSAHPVLLSQSLPLRAEPFDRKEARGFFAGILPDEGKRKTVARILGISAANDFSMLEKIGGECAGAVTFLPPGMSLADRPLAGGGAEYHLLTDDDLAQVLEELPRRPLLAGEEGVRLSLAGTQDKIAVCIAGNQISIPLGHAPSTHILKPAVAEFGDTVHNEAFCMQLAQAIGLTTACVRLDKVRGIEYLLVERYDRVWRETGGMRRLERLHQEDFCQALGIWPERKYQNEGGPSLLQCFDLIRRVSSAPGPDVLALLDAVIFNYLIGNNDAHGKNFSLLYGNADSSPQTTRLAPRYDVLSTLHYKELSPKMAMKLGGEYDIRKIGRAQFERFAAEAGLTPRLVVRRADDLAKAVISAIGSALPDPPGAAGIAALVTERCRRWLAGIGAYTTKLGGIAAADDELHHRNAANGDAEGPVP